MRTPPPTSDPPLLRGSRASFHTTHSAHTEPLSAASVATLWCHPPQVWYPRVCSGSPYPHATRCDAMRCDAVRCDAMRCEVRCSTGQGADAIPSRARQQTQPGSTHLASRTTTAPHRTAQHSTAQHHAHHPHPHRPRAPEGLTSTDRRRHAVNHDQILDARPRPPSPPRPAPSDHYPRRASLRQLLPRQQHLRRQPGPVQRHRGRAPRLVRRRLGQGLPLRGRRPHRPGPRHQGPAQGHCQERLR